MCCVPSVKRVLMRSVEIVWWGHYARSEKEVLDTNSKKKNGVQANSGVGEGGRETDTRYTEARVVKHSGQGDPASPTRHRKVLHATHRTTLVGNTYFQPWNI